MNQMSSKLKEDKIMANNIVLELENKAILSLTNYNELKAKADTLQEL